MAASSEPYSVAARRLTPAERDTGEPDAAEPDAAAVTACVNRTLAAPSARVASRFDLELPGTTEADRRRAPRRLQLIRLGLGSLFNVFQHIAREGFAEPAAQRYMIANRHVGEVFVGGQLFRGRVGRPLRTLTPERPGGGEDVDHNLLWPLWALSGLTAASFDGTDTVRDSLCRRFIVQADLARATTGDKSAHRDEWPVSLVEDPPPPHPPAFTVWTDGQHVRRVRFAKRAGNDIGPDLNGYGSLTQLELWDFGVPVAYLDWSRLPDFSVAGP
jgi:hypothetical protein